MSRSEMFFLVCLLVTPVAMAQTCTLQTCAEKICYSKVAEISDCLYSIPFNKEWALNNLDVLTQTLENFGFGALYHSTGPPYVINLDIQGELSAIRDSVNADEFTTDFDFQEKVQSVFQLTIDAHTRYQKPQCYNAVFVQPIAFDIHLPEDETAPVDEPAVYLMASTYAAKYLELFPTYDASLLVGKKVALINGLEPITEISQWGDTHETRSNNRGIRFNAALRSYLYRSVIAVNVLPMTDLEITLEDGSVHTLPWIATYLDKLADLSWCAAQPPELSAVEGENRIKSLRHYVPHKDPLIHLDSPPMQLTAAVTADRPDRTVIIPSPNTVSSISCFTQTVSSADGETAGINTVLVMKVGSFAPSKDLNGKELNQTEAFTYFLNDAQTCLENVASYDMLVVDVMQNGGGYVCLGLRLLELLVEDYANDYKKVQMKYDIPHSALYDAYINKVNDPDAGELLDPETQETFVDGKAYYYPGRNVTQGGKVSWRSNWFCLDCREAEAMPFVPGTRDIFRPAKFFTPDKLILLTDGTCGSTCASFTKIPQEAGKATLIGAGGLWGESMDVSSFAGGFVSNPAYFYEVATKTGLPFPQFSTNQNWQFGWGVWYSTKQPTRPTQFTSQDPDYREPFWGFPHTSVSADTTTDMVSNLYDQVISSSVTRVAATVEPDSDDTCSEQNTENIALIVACAVLAVCFIVAIGMYYSLLQKYNSKEYKHVSVSEYGEPADMTRNEPFIATNDA